MWSDCLSATAESSATATAAAKSSRASPYSTCCKSWPIVQALHAPYRLTRFATRLPPTYSKVVPTYVPFKLCWDTSVLIRRRYTPTSTALSSNNKCWSICHEINMVPLP